VDDDAELIERFLRGDRSAGSLLVARHSNALFAWLRWKTGCHEDAEDLAQIVWGRAFAALPRLEERARFRAWLFTIMRREFLHWLREKRPLCSLDALQEGAGDALDGGRLAIEKSGDALDAVSDRIALQNALAQLSEEHRDTFMLRYMSQFSAPEVASILDIPVGTVESRCHFARERLKTILKTLLQTSLQQAGDVQNNGRRGAQTEHRPINAPSPRSNEGKKPGLRGYFK
jgi:RNA polymerase sigma-70 factor (ECF subfamily)